MTNFSTTVIIKIVESEESEADNNRLHKKGKFRVSVQNKLSG